MKITRANVKDYADKHGLNPDWEDGYPEGFVWREDDITIGGKTHKGRKIKFKPLEEWDEGIEYE